MQVQTGTEIKSFTKTGTKSRKASEVRLVQFRIQLQHRRVLVYNKMVNLSKLWRSLILVKQEALVNLVDSVLTRIRNG